MVKSAQKQSFLLRMRGGTHRRNGSQHFLPGHRQSETRSQRITANHQSFRITLHSLTRYHTYAMVWYLGNLWTEDCIHGFVRDVRGHSACMRSFSKPGLVLSYESAECMWRKCCIDYRWWYAGELLTLVRPEN